MRTPPAHLRGYTIVELIMVLVISMALAAIVIPRYGSAIQNYRVDVAANQVAADLNYARTRATAASASRTVTFSVSGGTYSISGEKDISHPTLSYITDIKISPYHASLSTVNFGGSPSITFNGYGIPAKSGSVIVQVGTATRTINLSADSGIASVQ